MHVTTGDRSFHTGIVIWLLTGAAAYILLPWFALEYGLFDCTIDEYIDALGWYSYKPSLLVPLIFAACFPLLKLVKSRCVQAKFLVLTSLVTTFLIIVDFTRTGQSMGLGTGVILMVFAALFSYGIARLGFLQGDTFISGTVVFIIFVIGIFVFYPVIEIFHKVLIDREGGFAPLQFFKIISSFGIGRVILNTLNLAITVGVVTTLLGLLFALYAVRSTSPLRHLMRVFYILPIITPPFVVGMSLILLFGRAGLLSDFLVYLFGSGGVFIPEGADALFNRSGYIYGFSGIFLAQILSLTPVSYMVIHWFWVEIMMSCQQRSIFPLPEPNLTLPRRQPLASCCSCYRFPSFSSRKSIWTKNPLLQ